jgi:hypothetical protein
MTKIAAIALMAFITTAGAASAQTVYFGVGPNPYYAPPPSYGPYPSYGPGYYGPGYGPPPPPAYYGGPRYSREAMYDRPGRFKTWNGCQPGWTVQNGLCKPYRGY